ncbi:unnamed protein product [Adineta steineri]|uniref:Dyp-type peroxidase n=1 Tax=Adineta steineri TaxID=433720 RepID=A0A814UHW1_9BILA|nr:unnamed protein product [Adineta steineri]
MTPTIVNSDSLKQETIQDKSVDISNTYHCQTGVLTPFDINEHGLYIIFHLSNQCDDTHIKKTCQKLPELKEDLSKLNPGCRLEATLGIGYDKTKKWLSQMNIPIPKNLLEFKEKIGIQGKSMPSTGGDLFVHLRSNRKDLCFELGLQFCRLIPDKFIDQLEDTFGFAYMSTKSNGLSHDFTGFEDGNANPKTDQLRAKAALIQEGEDDPIHIGSSFALTQKWKHNLIKWNELSKIEQEKVFGRTRGDNSIKVKPLECTSHLARTDLNENGIDIKVVRQSLPYGGMKEHGLFFISYASSPHKHEKQLNSMVGIPDGIYDRLMDFSTAITGNYWLIPSINLLKKLC